MPSIVAGKLNDTLPPFSTSLWKLYPWTWISSDTSELTLKRTGSPLLTVIFWIPPCGFPFTTLITTGPLLADVVLVLLLSLPLPLAMTNATTRAATSNTSKPARFIQLPPFRRVQRTRTKAGGARGASRRASAPCEGAVHTEPPTDDGREAALGVRSRARP